MWWEPGREPGNEPGREPGDESGRALLVTAAVVTSLVLAWVHWLGLLVGGVVVGLLSRSWPRALAGGVGFGVLSWVAFLAVLWNAGRLDAYWGSGLLLYASLGIPVALGLVGSLAYAVKKRGRAA